MRKRDEKVSIELSQGEWQDVVDALESHSVERSQAADSTSNTVHQKAWWREADSLDLLAQKVEGRLRAVVTGRWIADNLRSFPDDGAGVNK